jgi:hypothetical protein
MSLTLVSSFTKTLYVKCNVTAFTMDSSRPFQADPLLKKWSNLEGEKTRIPYAF